MGFLKFFKRDKSPNYRAVKLITPKTYSVDVALMFQGKILKTLNMTIHAKDRDDAKVRLTGLLEFKISRLTEVKPKKNDK